MLIPPDKKNEDESSPASPAVTRPVSENAYPQQQQQQQDAAYPNLQVYAATHDPHPSAPSSSGSARGAYSLSQADLEAGRGASESSPLLAPPPPPPPPYQAAGSTAHSHSHGSSGSPHGAPTGGKSRPRTRMRFLAAGCAALVLLILGGAVAAMVGKMAGGGRGAGSGGGSGSGGGGGGGGAGDKMPAPEQPVQGGRGGSGKWDETWTPTYPIFANETGPRLCDSFTAASLVPDETYDNRALLSRSTSFRLPLSAERVYFHARGRGVQGHVVVTGGRTGGRGDSSEVDVRVEVRYAQGRRVLGWHVCRVGDDVAAGVVIVMPNEADDDEYRFRDVYFLVSIDYPSNHASRIGALEIDTHNMGVALAALSTRFGAVDARTTNGAVSVEDLDAAQLAVTTTNGRIALERVVAGGTPSLHTTNGAVSCRDCCPAPSARAARWDVHTSNGAVSGHYCAREAIDVETTTGSVTGTYEAPRVRAQTTNGRIAGVFRGITTGIDLRTTSGAVDARVEVVDAREAGAHGEHRVPLRVGATNGAVEVVLLNLPRDTLLDAAVSTTNGQLHFIGHPHFQGEFALSTTSGAVDFDTLESLPGEPVRKLSTVHMPTPREKSMSGSIVRKGETRAPGKLGRVGLHTTNSRLTALL